MTDALRPFTDSTDFAGDDAALRARLADDGYLFVRHLLPPEPLATLRRQCLDIIAEAGWLKAGTPPDAALTDPDAACADPDERSVAVIKRLYRLEALHALKHQLALTALFERLFGEPVLAHPLVIPRNIFPDRADFTTPAHQDFPHIQGTPETFTAWIPLADCPIDHGGLSVAEGTHKVGVHHHRVSSGAGAMEVADPLDGKWVAGDFTVGDVVIFHSMTVHRGLPNRTDRLRQSIDMRFQRASEPVTEISLSPYAGTGTWDEIYADWPTDTHKYYWRAQAPTVTPFDRRYYEERDEMAFEMARDGDEQAIAALRRIIQRDPDTAKRERAEDLLATLS
jgi:hypothetical protein